MFKQEQEEYTREGIDWKEIKFVDNQPLLVSLFGFMFYFPTIKQCFLVVAWSSI